MQNKYLKTVFLEQFKFMIVRKKFEFLDWGRTTAIHKI